MLDGENQAAFRLQRGVDGREQFRQALDVVKGQRAVREIECPGWQRGLFEVCPPIVYAAFGSQLPRPSEHPLGNVERQHASGTMLPRPSAEPAISAAQVHDGLVPDVAHHVPQRRPLGRARQAVDGPAEAAVAFEEGGVVVDVLAHGADATRSTRTRQYAAVS